MAIEMASSSNQSRIVYRSGPSTVTTSTGSRSFRNASSGVMSGNVNSSSNSALEG